MLIDVSQRIEQGSVFRLGTPPVEISSKAFFHESEGKYETTMLSLAAHTATHIDLVYRAKRLPLKRMIGKGKLVDITQITDREVQIAEMQNQVKIQPDDFVFFRTGWSKWLGTERYYHHPELSQAVIEWLASMQVNMIGIDALGLGRGRKHGQYDRYLAEKDIFVIENLDNLSAIPVKEFTVYCFPLKVEDVDAIPARVVVEIP